MTAGLNVIIAVFVELMPSVVFELRCQTRRMFHCALIGLTDGRGATDASDHHQSLSDRIN